MKKYLIFLILINTIKSEAFYAKEVNGHNIEDEKNGYSSHGNFILTDFYLCSERKYKVHYLGEDDDKWSEEFTACQPVGNGKSIDGLSISGGLEYGIRHELRFWIRNITKYNISEKDGFAGQLGDEIDAVYVYGDEIYRAGQINSDCSHENEVAKRLIAAFFKKNYKYEYNNFSYENEINIYFEKDTKIKVTVKLLKPYEINYKGKLTYKSEFQKLINSNCNKTISTNLKKILNDTINLDITSIEKFIEAIFADRVIIWGDIMINFNWAHNKIELEEGSKITIGEICHNSYRGGFRINFYLNDEDSKLLYRIKIICLIIIQYSGKWVPNTIKKILTSDSTVFKDFEEVLNSLGSFSIIAEQVIFFEIISTLAHENFEIN